MVVSLTRLRLRSVLFLPGFAFYAFGSLREIKAAPGFLGGRLLNDRKLAFWTLTTWTDEAALRHWRGSGAHGRSMPKLKRWCDEAGVARWELPDTAALPDWTSCHEQMIAHGRLTPVLQPSPAQQAGVVATPAPTTRPSFVPIQRKRA